MTRAAAGWLSRAAAVMLAITASAAGAAAAATPASASARPIGDCTTTAGVVVAVDFGHWGGPLLRSCGTTPTTGYALLNQGGWQTAGTEHDGPGFVCRIGYAGYHGGALYPTPARQSCVLTPPASAYWSFWQASRGQDAWTYSQAGAMSYHPEPGSVELWMFGSTSPGGTAGSAVPAFSPDSVRALNTGPAGPASTSPDGAASTSAAAGATSAPATISPAPRRRNSAPAAARATPPRTPAVLDAPPAAASAHVSHGSPVPALVALVVVMLLAAAGITAAARRPRRER